MKPKNKPKKKPNQITFAETAETEGLISEIDRLSIKAKRKRNNYLNLVLSQHVQDANETAEED